MRSGRVVAWVVGVILGVNLLLAVINSIVGTPGGPTSSSYATGLDGLAGYASLVERSGHGVQRLTDEPDELRLDPATTVVLLDSTGLSRNATVRLHAFVARGGTLIAGGSIATWTRRIVPGVDWEPAGRSTWHPVVPMPFGLVSSDALGRFSDTSSALPVLGDARGALALEARIGMGRAILLADASPLQNAHLGRLDNAAFGLWAAGPRGRTVAFVESVHGYGQEQGFKAIPARWRWMLLLGTLAVAAAMFAVGRRLGPPQLPDRELGPARIEYVDALAATLRRTRDPASALAGVRRVVSERIERTRAVLEPDELDAVTAPRSDDATILALGRALTKT